MKTEEDIEQYKETWNRLDILKSLVPWAFVVQIVSSASNILINGSMLYGVTQKKAGFMLPWLIFGMISIVVSIFNVLLIEVKRSFKGIQLLPIFIHRVVLRLFVYGMFHLEVLHPTRGAPYVNLRCHLEPVCCKKWQIKSQPRHTA